MFRKPPTIEKCCDFKVKAIPRLIESGDEYTVDGVRSPRLILEVGKVYIFNIHTPNHPFYITTHAIGGTKKLEGAVISPDNVGIENGELEFMTTLEMVGKKLYYQCDIHKSMGYKIEVRKKTFSE